MLGIDIRHQRRNTVRAGRRLPAAVFILRHGVTAMSRNVLKVAKNPIGSGFAIIDTRTGRVLDGGFSSRSSAEDYMCAEYDAVTGASRETSYTGR